MEIDQDGVVLSGPRGLKMAEIVWYVPCVAHSEARRPQMARAIKVKSAVRLLYQQL